MFNFPIRVDFMKDKRINDLLYGFCLLNSFVAKMTIDVFAGRGTLRRKR